MRNLTKGLFFSPLLLAALIGGSWFNALILMGVAVLFMLNHWFLIRLVSQLTHFMASKGDEITVQSLSRRLMVQSGLKLTLLAATIATLYFLQPQLLVKALILMIFQLIIFVVSIKNNSLKDLGMS